MDLSDWPVWIGIYGAVAATGGLVWQWWVWHDKRRTVMELRLSVELPRSATEWLVSLTAINKSEHPIRLVHAGIDMQDNPGARMPLLRPFPDSQIPGLVQPYDSATTWFIIEDMKVMGLTFDKPLVGWVRTVDNQKFASKPTTINEPS